MATLLKTDQLLVSRQDPETRLYSRAGVLSFDGEVFRFAYSDGATRAMPGLPLGRVHVSQFLFPIFAERMMDAHRPERAETLKALGLESEAEPLEVLAVSGGGRTGDTYELTPLPQPGSVSLPFLVHGIRYLTHEERAAIDELKPGDPLDLRCEEGNPVNERALLVRQDGQRLGYVPDPLLDYVHRIMESPYELVVQRVNPVGAGMHVRLLVRLTGELVGSALAYGRGPNPDDGVQRLLRTSYDPAVRAASSYDVRHGCHDHGRAGQEESCEQNSSALTTTRTSTLSWALRSGGRRRQTTRPTS